MLSNFQTIRKNMKVQTDSEVLDRPNTNSQSEVKDVSFLIFL